ncbi:group III truncated hemoglobin [Deinococcus budaensis]|uniref:Hemoglobin n=1 Tax=Deinococcus budaensis TaxID=1665626 RepID=A0A7W8GDR7_9DEIO|nr:group III truncated hemoglobin [Deinococcus budaensis]MBB5233549.1 hemoglobin [Deinococcus budaensis]
MPGAPLLSPFPVPGWDTQAATPQALSTAGGLLVPHDGEPVADVRDRPDRWARLTLVAGAVRRGLPVLAWGTGAALAGRVLGARVQPGGPAGDWAEVPRGAEVQAWQGEVPLLWRTGRVTAWAGAKLPDPLKADFLAGLPGATARTPGTPLEALGGEAALRALLADFYARARADTLLGPVFGAHVTDWDAHLDHVTAFWVTLLGGAPLWRGNLNRVHAGLGVRGPHLERWLELFGEAARAHLPPEAAALILARAGAMGARLGPPRGGRGNGPHPGRVP